MVIGFSGIRSFFARHPHVKTSFFWSRCKWLHQKARADGKSPLLLNLDETVVPLEFKHVRVNLIHKSGGEKIKGLPKQNEQYERAQEVVLHVHLVLEKVGGDRFNFRSLASGFRLGSMDASHIKGMVDPVTAKKANGAQSMHVQMPKAGQVHMNTNYDAYTEFLVNPRWITGHFQSKKISEEDAKKVSVFFMRSGVDRSSKRMLATSVRPSLAPAFALESLKLFMFLK